MNKSEVDLIKRCQSGSREAFDSLYREYHPMVLHIARKIMGNEQDAEDAVQEVFERVLDRIGQFRYEASFSSWLRVLAKNVCRDILRKKGRHPTESLDNLCEFDETGITAKRYSISQEEELIMKELLENLHEKLLLSEY